MARHPQGTETAPQSGSSQRRGRRLTEFRRAQLVVEARHGSTPQYVIKFEGRSWRFDGDDCLHDVMTTVARRLM